MPASKLRFGLCMLLVFVGIISILTVSHLTPETIPTVATSTHENLVMVSATQTSVIAEECQYYSTCALFCEAFPFLSPVVQANLGYPCGNSYDANGNLIGWQTIMVTFSATSTFNSFSTIQSLITYSTQKTVTVPLYRTVGLTLTSSAAIIMGLIAVGIIVTLKRKSP